MSLYNLMGERLDLFVRFMVDSGMWIPLAAVAALAAAAGFLKRYHADRLETEPDCPECGSRSVITVTDGDVQDAPHVRDEVQPQDRRCLTCGERWNPANTPRVPGSIAKVVFIPMVVFVSIATLVTTLYSALILKRYRSGDLPAERARELKEFTETPFASVAGEWVEVMKLMFTNPWVAGIVLAVMILIVGAYVAENSRLETDGGRRGL